MKYSVDMIMLYPLRKTIIVEAENEDHTRHVAANQADMDNWQFQTENGPITLSAMIKEEIANFGAAPGLRIV